MDDQFLEHWSLEERMGMRDDAKGYLGRNKRNRRGVYMCLILTLTCKSIVSDCVGDLSTKGGV